MKSLNKHRLVLVLLLLLVPCLGSLPHGWRLPAPAELADTWRDASPSRYASLTGDFTGDGIADEAKLLLREDGSGFGLFAFVHQPDNTFTAYLLDAVDAGKVAAPGDALPGVVLQVMGIKPVPSGEYTTACGKGYFDCQPGEPERIRLPHMGIEYFKEESAASYFYWDAATHQFLRVWIRD